MENNLWTLRDKHILVAATGSVAAIRCPKVINLIVEEGAEVWLLTTEHSWHFLEKEQRLPRNHIRIFTDADEWRNWNKLGDPVLHIELRKWADAFLIAPIDANTLAKAAVGLCDNLVSSVIRAWDSMNKPLLVAPAMNTVMWEQPLTHQQLSLLESRNVKVIPTVSKQLACGDIGYGAMATPETIIGELKQCLLSQYN
ncbi:Phosphopantothenoylcysteine decarboxylase [Galdieria sulphuraria]|uniref:Phosphopantothenoylcysteine decarboxylase n=1 Tax=Galdieria sulphuraria TaxID=130081 RepID=M2XPK5_GALSU|nr:phosphopantothenoylcysteine decarboxylase [Galdieria sulphuraria]EME32147.1 phosphopantothenoylcysteine decarboxylase [Galdieria sulphuraria]GJD09571.1 Phosphopantothenoylcysteine decarboxylase [Galdieria sulphuraria]|eukprot:XP_005708667.1 phosphopantothenoylcysteine decarboxylase [Galdieria sulphuraria]